MYWLLFKTFPKALYAWSKYKLAQKIIRYRNKAPQILLYPDPRLKVVAIPVDFEKTSYDDRATLVRKMGAALSTTTYGMRLGIAATQIGINQRVVIVRGNVMFNPVWVPSKAPTDEVVEACYSVPNKMFKVNRAPYGWARWMNIAGRPMEDKLSGLPAAIFQHEVDHLDGRCCVDVGVEYIEPK